MQTATFLEDNPFDIPQPWEIQINSQYDPEDVLCFMLLHADGRTTHIFRKQNEITEEFYQYLHEQNKTKSVYIAMNAFQEMLTIDEKDRPSHSEPYRTAKKGRSEKNIKTIRAVYLDVDYDGATRKARIESDPRLPKAHLILNTSPGKFQFIWFVEPMSVAEQRELLHRLIQEFGGDPAAADAARVLRLAGFKNQKKEYSSPVVTIVDSSDAPRYRTEDFKVSASVTPAAPKTGDKTPSGKEWKIACEAWEKLGPDATETDVTLEFFSKAGKYREKWEKNKDYVSRTIRKAKEAVFGSTKQNSGAVEILEPIVQAKTDAIADMSDAVLDGRLGEIYQRRLSPEKNACGFPISYGWTALTTVAGVMVPRAERSALTTTEAERTNLYVVQIGPIHSGKSLVINRAKSVLGLPDVMYSDTKAGSSEGLLKKLNNEFHSGKRTDRLLQDLDEWKHYFRKAEIDGASFMTILNTGFYKDRYNLVIARGEEIDFNCSISWIGGVVQEEYGDVVGAAALGGFYDRLYQGVCPTGFNLSYFPHEVMPEEVNPIPVQIDGSVWEAAREWKTENPEVGRAVEVVIRVAHICASFDGRSVLYGKDLRPAKALLDEQMRVREMFKPNIGENPDARCMLAILDWLRKVAPNHEWVNMRDLQRGINYTRFGAIVFSRCIQALSSQYAREIETATLKVTRTQGGGHGTMVVRLAE